MFGQEALNPVFASQHSANLPAYLRSNEQPLFSAVDMFVFDNFTAWLLSINKPPFYKKIMSDTCKVFYVVDLYFIYPHSSVRVVWWSNINITNAVNYGFWFGNRLQARSMFTAPIGDLLKGGKD